MKKIYIFQIMVILLLLFNSILVYADTGTFGYESIGGTTTTLEDTIMFGKFTTDDVGVNLEITTMSIYITYSGAPRNLRGGIYDLDNDVVTNGKTDEKVGVTSGAWNNLVFSTNPELSPDTTYYFGVVGLSASFDIECHYDTSGGLGVFSQSYSYGALPDTITPSTVDADGIISIHMDYSYTPAPSNTAPTIEIITPINNSVGNNLTGYISAWFNDTESNSLNISWLYYDGSYNIFADNNSVASNTRYDVYYSGFNANCTVYKFMITVDDGFINTSRNYTYTTICPFVNTAPNIDALIPENESTGYNTSGYCKIFANDTNGHTLNITWLYYDGTYITYADNNSVASNTTYDIYFTFFNGDGITYYWMVIVDDGYDNVSFIFHFTTYIETLPTINISSYYPLTGDYFNPLSEVFGFDLIGAVNFNVLVYLSDNNIDFFLWESSYNTNITSYYFITTNFTFYNNSVYYWYLNLTEYGNATNTYETDVNTFTVGVWNNATVSGNYSIGENMEINIINTQFWYLILCIFWLFITWVNIKDVYEKQINKFNAIVHVFFTAPLFILILHDSYINSLIYGYFFAFGIIFTTIYIVSLKFIHTVET